MSTLARAALFRGAPSIVLTWCFALGGTSCASLAGLAGGGDADVKQGSGAEAGVDAGSVDATTRDARDSGPREAAARDATDAAADQSTDAADARRVDADAPAEASRDAASDALPDGCTPYVIPDSGHALTCAAVDGNACNPNLPGFVPVWRPPSREVVCSTPQIIEYVAACFGPNASTADCTAFTEDAMNAACYQCMFTNDRTSSKLGPIIYESGIDVYATNGPGCLALADPCQIDCAKAIDAARECLEEACSNCAAATPDWYDCQTEAAACSCLAYQTEAAACSNALASRPEDMDCFPSQSFAAIAQAYGVYFCAGGPLVLDAGADGG